VERASGVGVATEAVVLLEALETKVCGACCIAIVDEIRALAQRLR
jgi:hypothetical protein